MILGNYKRDGFVILKGAISAEQTLAPEELAIMHRHLKDTLTRSTEAYLQTVRLLAKGVSVHQIFCSTAIYNACQELGCRMPVFVSDPVVHITSEDLKIPGGYFGVGAHQDWPAVQGSLNAVTIWCPMHHVGRDDYPLEVVPGSHKMGLLPAKANSHWSEVDTEGMQFQPVEVHRGDALLFSAFLVHRTRTQGRGLRIAYSHRANDAMEAGWKKRNYECAQSRKIDRDIKYTPTAEEVAAIYAEAT